MMAAMAAVMLVLIAFFRSLLQVVWERDVKKIDR
jgi:hypothetical protein